MADCGDRGPEAAASCSCDYHARNNRIAEQAGYTPGQNEDDEERRRRTRSYT